MGCGGSKAVCEFVEKNPKEDVGKSSEFERAVTLIEELKKSQMIKILRVQYKEKSKGLKIGDAQHWLIQGSFADGKKEHETYGVWISATGEHEVQIGSF